jgi:prepilin-type processing-associated H-X9-DG protein
MRRNGMTRVEVIVAVVVIGGLVAFLLPALGPHPGKPSARRMCLANLKRQGNALAVYAEDFSGSTFPFAKKLTSLCQQDLETREALAGAVGATSGLDEAAVRKTFYCPGNAAQDPAKLWETGGVSTWGYVWLNDRGAAGTKLPTTCPPWPAPTRTLPPEYLRSLKGLRAPNSVLVALDVVVTDTDAAPLNYTPKGVAVDFGSSHMTAGKPFWVNVLFADGHAESVKFDEEKAVAVPQPGGGYFWPAGN